MEEIITFDVYIDEEAETGVDKISLVKRPAIMTDFIYMEDEDSAAYRQLRLSEDKQIIVGPALIPNLEIIRKDEDGEPYFIKYSEEQIEKIAQKFFKFKGAHEVNKEHKDNKAEETYIFESWIVGEDDKAKSLGFDVPKGTWMVSMKVENEELWNQIKSGKYKGFSIEGLFKFKRGSKLVKQEKFFRRRLKSSNVNAILYDDETKEMVIRFQGGELYTYFDIEPDTFRLVVSGTGGVCKTEGKNQFGSWEVGKTPSIGAAVWQQLREKNVRYTKGGVLEFGAEEIELKKVSFDYDETLTTEKGMAAAKRAIENGDDVYIISARRDKEGMLSRAEELGIPASRVIATGSNKAKVEKVKELNIEKHYDNNGDVVKELGSVGVKMTDEKNDMVQSNIVMENQVDLVKPGSSENESEFISRCMGDKKMNSEYPDQSQRAAVCYAYWSEKQEKINVNMVSAILKDGNTLYTDAEAMAVGVEVYFQDEAGNKVSPDNGEYELEDGTIVVIENSMIKEIKDMSAMSEDVEAGMKEDKKKEAKMELDPMMMEQFDALKGMIENLNLKIDALMADEVMSSVQQSITDLDVKLEKVIADNEMKKVEPTDSLKKVAQSETKKSKLDYDVITRYNKKF